MRDEQYRLAARRAINSAEHETSMLVDVHHSGNMVLYLFLEEIKRLVRGEAHLSRWHQSVSKAAQSVKSAQGRIYDDQSLLRLPSVGPQLLMCVKDNLWGDHPPEPPSEEELQLEAERKAEEKRIKKATKAVQQARPSIVQPTAQQPGAGSSLLLGRLADGNDDMLSPGSGGRKGRKTAAPKEKRPYRPLVGTANYAFLVCLLQAEARGQEFVTKNQLMDDAEQSGLSDKPIRGDKSLAMQNPRNYFDGWSNFKKLLNNDPPFANAYSNPKKIILTEQGRPVAMELYRDAVARGKMMEDPNIPLNSPQNGSQGQSGIARGSENRMPNFSLPPMVSPPAPAVAPAASKRRLGPPPMPQSQNPHALPPAATSASAVSRGPATWQRLGPSLAGLGTALPCIRSPPDQTNHGHTARESPGGTSSTTGMGPQAGGTSSAPGFISPPLGSRFDPNTRGRAGPSSLVQVQPSGTALVQVPRSTGAVPLGAPLPSQPGGATLPSRGLPREKSNKNAQKSASTILPAPCSSPKGLPESLAVAAGPCGGPECDSDSEVICLDDSPLPRRPPALGLQGEGNVSGPGVGTEDLCSPPAKALTAADILFGAGDPASGGLGGCGRKNDGNGGAAVLCSMGYSQDQAARALQGGRSLEEALDVIEVLSSEDEGPDDHDDSNGGSGDQPDARREMVGLRDRLGFGQDPGPPPLNPGKRKGDFPETVLPKKTAPSTADLPTAYPPPLQHAPSSQHSAVVPSNASLQPTLASSGPGYSLPPIPGRAAPLPVAHDSSDTGALAARAASHMPVQSQQSGSEFASEGARPGTCGPAALARNGSGAASASGFQRAGSGSGLSGVGQGSRGGLSGAGRGDDGEGDGSEDSLGSIWRLPGLGGEWGVEEGDVRIPPMPPGRLFQEEFDVVLVLDMREQFARGNNESRIAAIDRAVSTCQLHGVMCEKRTLGIGDVVWLARSRRDPTQEYVLDHVIERKSMNDLAKSIQQKRYDQQKYVLHRCGLRRPMYLAEGDPDHDVPHRQEWAAKAIRTALVACEVVDGFMVLRTENAPATKRMYGDLTRCLQAKYGPLHTEHEKVARGGQPLRTFAEFQRACVVAKDMTVRDVWGLILTAVEGVGPMVIDAILRVYPTPLSLFRAYEDAAARARAEGRDPVAAAKAVLQGIHTSPGRGITLRQSALVYDQLFANGCQ